MNARINYPPLTDEETLWESRDDAIAFFDEFNVSAATKDNYGVVKQAQRPQGAYPNPELTSSYFVIKEMIADGSLVEHVVVEKAAWENLQSEFVKLASSYAELITNLTAAGILKV